jgi:hypothetical protein
MKPNPILSNSAARPLLIRTLELTYASPREDEDDSVVEGMFCFFAS